MGSKIGTGPILAGLFRRTLVAFWRRIVSFTGLNYTSYLDFFGTGGLDCAGIEAPALPTTLPYRFCGGLPGCATSGLALCDLPPCRG